MTGVAIINGCPMSDVERIVLPNSRLDGHALPVLGKTVSLWLKSGMPPVPGGRLLVRVRQRQHLRLTERRAANL